MRRSLPDVTGFARWGKRAMSQECGSPLEAEKSKEMGYSLDLPERTTALPNL